MNWTNRMARHGSERSLHSLAVQTTAAAATPVTPSGSEANAAANGGRPSSPRSAGVPTVVSPEDSRIPRPSSTLLRRSASMRLRGERISHIRPTAASSSPHQQTHRNHRTSFLQQHRQNGAAGHNNHSYQRQDNFPVITENGDESPRHRSLSLSLTPARPRHGSAADDSDGESVKSFGSVCSTASACDHAHFALNGTTWSGRSRKYVVHCSSHNEEGDQYLTPTQRAARQLRKFQALLKDARKEIEDKDREIFRLTKEVVELRLYKASLNSPDERTDSSDALTVRDGNPLSPESPCCKDLPDEGSFEAGGAANSDPAEKLASSADLPSSLADSGHFEDGSVHSKDSVGIPSSAGAVANTAESAVPAANDGADAGNESLDEERRRIVDLYERRIEEMHRGHVDEIQELKQRHNDKVESLLNQLSEVNTRYCEVRPAMDNAETRTRELEQELEVVKAELAEQKAMLDDQEERNKKMYLKMYTKGQEAARLEHEDELPEQARGATSKASTAELMRQLTLTQAELDNIKAMYRRIVESRSSEGALDPEITLQFLKSAVYYFLTDKENFHGHLNAIESILGFTDTEKLNIDKAFGSARK